MTKKVFLWSGILIVVLALFAGGGYFVRKSPSSLTQKAGESVDGERMLEAVRYQVSLGARTMGSPAHEQVVSWLTGELKDSGWEVSLPIASQAGHQVQNIVAQRSMEADAEAKWIIVGAHYDSRFFADQDPDPAKWREPVPGANDGASGVAVLLELARVLPPDLPAEVWLVFFDAEDNGGIDDWDWILGSRAFAATLQDKPDAVIVVDMVGDADLNIYLERNSNPALSASIWSTAIALGYGSSFIPLPKYAMLDDHIPFKQAGIPAVDIIDFDYPYWHTTADTPDKLSAASLQVVADTLREWLSQPKMESSEKR